MYVALTAQQNVTNFVEVPSRLALRKIWLNCNEISWIIIYWVHPRFYRPDYLWWCRKILRQFFGIILHQFMDGGVIFQ